MRLAIALLSVWAAFAQTTVKPNQLRGIRPGTKDQLVLVDGSNHFRSVKLGAGLELRTETDGSTTIALVAEPLFIPRVQVVTKPTSQSIILTGAVRRALVYRNGVLLYAPDDYIIDAPTAEGNAVITLSAEFHPVQPDDVVVVVWW